MEKDKFIQANDKLRKLNGITKKNADRLIVDLINNPEKIESAKEAIDIIANSLGECPICFYLTIDGECPICSDETRDQNKICVVSNILHAKNIEDSGYYKGLYAITKGEINITKNVTPDKLKIDEIFKRVNLDTELILALNATFNGEVTANYIKEIAKRNNVNYSRIAKGIPMGGVLDYMDQETIKDALENRKK